jgi:antitoxin HigA-1
MLPKHRPPTHPGEMLLKEFLEPLEVSQVDAATRMGVPFQRLNSLINGRRGVTADTALRLEALTGMEATFWMGLQADFDLWQALQEVDRPSIIRLGASSAKSEDAPVRRPLTHVVRRKKPRVLAAAAVGRVGTSKRASRVHK